MSNWQVGDLAVCVDDRPLASTPWGTLRKGHVGRVLSVVIQLDGTCLLVEGARSGHPQGRYRAEHFRKIRPDEHEACEPEFVTLLRRLDPAQPFPLHFPKVEA